MPKSQKRYQVDFSLASPTLAHIKSHPTSHAFRTVKRVSTTSRKRQG